VRAVPQGRIGQLVHPDQLAQQRGVETAEINGMVSEEHGDTIILSHGHFRRKKLKSCRE
jgi:hypothetical protein